ncbi:MAG: hypothetical protein WD577_04605 [Bacteroidales bacterium]
MKRVFFLFVLAVFAGLTSCDMLGDVIPDIDKVVTETYEFVIDESIAEGITEEEFIDIRAFEEFQTYSQYVDGYLLSKATYEILDFNAPEDLYFTGSIKVSDVDSTTLMTLATIAPENLEHLSSFGEEQEFVLDTAAVTQVIEWMEDPGSFNISFSYAFQNADGSDYEFAEEDFGSSFKVKTNLYLIISTNFSTTE